MDITDVKRELSSDEKVLESAFKLETLYKKYKVVIWAVIIGLLVFFLGRSVMQTLKEARLAEANAAFMTLQTKADDAEALATLKEKNPVLFELFTFAQASNNKDVKALKALSDSSNEVVADSSRYAAAAIEKKKSDSILYKEMSFIEDAYLDIKAGKAKEAQNKLALIGEDSPLSMLAALLKHSTLKAK